MFAVTFRIRFNHFPFQFFHHLSLFVITPAQVNISMLLIANLYTGLLTDIIFGSLATLIAAAGTYCLRKKPLLAAACPVVSNGVIVGLVLALSFNLPVALTMAEVAVGEIGAVVIGMILLTAMKRAHIDLTRLS